MQPIRASKIYICHVAKTNKHAQKRLIISWIIAKSCGMSGLAWFVFMESCVLLDSCVKLALFIGLDSVLFVGLRLESMFGLDSPYD